MFFKRRYFRLSRFSSNFIVLFNLFFNFNNFFFEFLGMLGFLKIFLNSNFFIKSNNCLKIFSINDIKKHRIINSNGFIYSIIINIIRGLNFQYEKKIILFGLGYKVFLKFNYLYFYLSYSHPIIYNIPTDITVKINSSNEVAIFGLNKQRVGEVCLFLKNFKKPDSYKGKGIKYLNEKVNLKLIKKK